MKRIATFVAICTLVCMVSLFVLKSNKVSASPAPKPPAGCFINGPASYPKAAPALAPRIALNPNADPAQLYAQFQLLTRNERIKFFNILSGTNKAAVWSVHIRSYALNHDLNAQQQAFIADSLALLKGADYDANGAALASKAGNIKAQAILLFGPEQAWELIAHLGGKPSVSNSQQIAHYYVPGVASWNAPACECNPNMAFCEWFYDFSYSCQSNLGMCDYQSWGCGPYGLLNCWGSCVKG